MAHVPPACSLDGAVLGRCVTDLKVSASPGRDRTNDEERGAGGGACDVTNTRKRSECLCMSGCGHRVCVI